MVRAVFSQRVQRAAARTLDRVDRAAEAGRCPRNRGTAGDSAGRASSGDFRAPCRGRSVPGQVPCSRVLLGWCWDRRRLDLAALAPVWLHQHGCGRSALRPDSRGEDHRVVAPKDDGESEVRSISSRRSGRWRVGWPSRSHSGIAGQVRPIRQKPKTVATGAQRVLSQCPAGILICSGRGRIRFRPARR